MTTEIHCPNCHAQFVIADTSIAKGDIRYCPFCRRNLYPEKASTIHIEHTKDASSMTVSTTTISFLPEHVPEAKQILFTIGPYQVLQSIGKGGMGEVFLAYDTTCGRRIALKQIRPDLITHKQLHNRFLKEARITSQLAHPAIIPIYAIHTDTDLTYYTMPYVEGRTLKQLLRNARQQQQKGEKMDHIAESIPALIRIFLSICQAVAYAHSKCVLHRDLKPENIIVGQYGQIVILDWGLAKMLRQEESSRQNSFEDEKSEDSSESLSHLTTIGKVVGTITYMAPERAMGQPANFQTDIYSLGVILYQLLTLKLPFYRDSLKEFRKTMHREKLIDPIEIAPYRDIPRSLSLVVLKCLATELEQRYHTVDQLIHDLENYIEGRSEWFQIAQLDIKKKSDWEFQENVFIAEHIALTRETDTSDWVNLMISKDSFQETIKIDAKVKIGESGHGLGLLLSVPEAAERRHINDGYCLWLGTEVNRSTKLLRSTVEVLAAPDVFLKRHKWQNVRVEKIENNIHVYIEDVLKFSYISHMPLTGTHVGLLLRDDDLSIKDLCISVGSHNVTVNCLAVPDAFLAHNDYATALNEYRRIGYSFPGRAEGREAMFRAGITLLEQANNTQDLKAKEEIYDLAQQEFHKLHKTPGAPLEYLGKALVYQSLGDFEEEAKCFELAYRRYPRHPLLPILEEQIVYRMHDSSRHSRKATFNFILLVVRYLPAVASTANTVKLLRSLERHWEPLFFIEREPSAKSEHFRLATKLAFWLARPYTLSEIIDELIEKEGDDDYSVQIVNALFCLIELGCWELAKNKWDQVIAIPKYEASAKIRLLDIILMACEGSLESAIQMLEDQSPSVQSTDIERVTIFLMEKAIDQQKTSLVHKIFNKVREWPVSLEGRLSIYCCEIWASLAEKNWEHAGELLNEYPLELLSQETSILHFLYGCWLDVTEGKEIASIHFLAVFEVNYPRTWTLFSHYFKGKIVDKQEWIDRSFLWERRQLYRQLELFYYCTGESDKALLYRKKIQEEVIDIS